MELTLRLSLCLFGHVLALNNFLYGGDESLRRSVDVERIPKLVRVALGECSNGQPFQAKLRLHNQTDLPWTIRKIETDCGCLSAVTDRQSVESGASVELEVQLAATNKIAKVRRVVRLYTNEFDGPLAIQLDIAVTGPLQLDRSIFELKPGQERLVLSGKKRDSQWHIDRIFSGRGGFLMDRSVEQDAERFRLVVRPMSRFGAFSDLVRIHVRKGDDPIQVLEMPIEIRSINRVRFLPSTVSLTRSDGHWSGETRMIIAPESEPIDLPNLRFQFADENTTAKVSGKVQSLSSVLSLVRITVSDNGQQNMPHLIEIEDRNGSLLGNLHLLRQGQTNDEN